MPGDDEEGGAVLPEREGRESLLLAAPAVSVRRKPKGECAIPHRPRAAAINRSMIGKAERESNAIREYFESEVKGEKVAFLEKVATEHVFRRKLDAWAVHTKRGRYWVITNPTNQYSQRDFPSLDYMISFHIGLMTRVMSRHRGRTRDAAQDRLAASARRIEQASQALDRSEEAEDFQAVGMRCREALLTIARDVGQAWMVPPKTEPPKIGDFVHWSILIADSLVAGPSGARIRGYLKSVAESAWELVGWLTHARNAVASDGQLVLDATEAVFAGFSCALLRFEAAHHMRCPRCNSYRVVIAADPSINSNCDACGHLYSGPC